MSEPRGAGALGELRRTLETLADRLREVEGLRARAARLAADLAAPPAPVGGGGPQTERQGALLVALTLRGGTLGDDELTRLAEELGVAAAQVEQLFDGPEPFLDRRIGGAARLTERGLDAAGSWRRALPAELLEAATRL